MKTSTVGRSLITEFEGLRLTAYRCSANVLTIGVGHTSAAGAPKVVAGMTITRAEADAILSRDLAKFERAVAAAVKVPVSQNQFDALVSLAFNIGERAFGRSTLVKRLNAGRFDEAADQFAAWNKVNRKAVAGLTRRRAAEAKLFRTAFAAPVAITLPVPTTTAPQAKPSAPGFLTALLSLFRRKAV